MAASTLRNRDMHVEREIAKFLDVHLYSNPMFQNVRRTDTLEEQLSGSDLTLSIPSLNLKDIIVDEKAQTQYINHPLPTFALELSFLNSNNQLIEGWLTDKSKVTQYYLFQWIHEADNGWNLEAKDIKILEFALVSRTSILDYLNANGFPLQKLREKDSEIRQTGKYGQHDKGSKKFWFFYSTNLAEKPINLILKKEVYLELAATKGLIKI